MNTFAPSQITAELQGLSDEDLGMCLTDPAAYQELVKKLIKSSQVTLNVHCVHLILSILRNWPHGGRGCW